MAAENNAFSFTERIGKCVFYRVSASGSAYSALGQNAFALCTRSVNRRRQVGPAT